MKVNLEFRPRDAWIGFYWSQRPFWNNYVGSLDIWVCLIPCFPIHIVL